MPQGVNGRVWKGVSGGRISVEIYSKDFSGEAVESLTVIGFARVSRCDEEGAIFSDNNSTTIVIAGLGYAEIGRAHV